MVSPDPTRPNVAVILAGAVTRGAFEAGVLKVLADSRLDVVRIVAASSGALNGSYFASALRARRAREGAQELIELWRERADWSDVFHCNLADLVKRRGFSDTTKLDALLHEVLHPVQVPDPAPVNLRIVVSPIEGVPTMIGDVPAISYEHMLEFDGPAFDTAAGLERVINATVASASLPVVFTPTHVPGLGDCVDGGAVNNNPIGYALDGAIGQQISAVIVVTPSLPRWDVSAQQLRGVELVGQLIEALINERLYRDLRRAAKRNAAMRRLDALSPDTLDSGQLAAVKRALSWERARFVEVITIRPVVPLPGTAFSGFIRPAEREADINIGMERAEAVLDELGWR